MLEAFEVIKTPTVAAQLEAVLTFEERQKSRYKTTVSTGQNLAWFIPRGQVLCDGDYLCCKTGELIRVVAAPETVSQVNSADQLLLTRAAYHLGNRHVPLQIGAGYLRYQHDHVLDAMVQGLGLNVLCQQLPFQPENGAYHGQSHHGHSHTVAGDGATSSHTVSRDGTVHTSSVSADGRSHSYSSAHSSGSHSVASSHASSSSSGEKK